jgi:glycosyltransferase involved in cell wall biosynthesis
MIASDALFSLAVVIPVWNDASGLSRLIPQLLAAPYISQIIIADDLSDPPCDAKHLDLPEDSAKDPRLIWLRSDDRRGAGHARNLGLQQVTAPYVLFFDSDDLLLPGLDELVADLAQPATPQFDFCLFRHVDSRRRAVGDLAPLQSDQRHWDTIAVANTASLLSTSQKAQICRISAYPWNKIYRSEFLRTQQIRCTEIMVHNDVELHWTSILRAKHILASSRICCEHFVHETGKRLTNRSGAERIEVFAALDVIQSDIAASPHTAATYADAAIEFYLNLFQWILSGMEERFHATFHDKARAFLQTRLSLPVVTIAARRDPPLIGRLNRFLESAAP